MVYYLCEGITRELLRQTEQTRPNSCEIIRPPTCYDNDTGRVLAIVHVNVRPTSFVFNEVHCSILWLLSPLQSFFCSHTSSDTTYFYLDVSKSCITFHTHPLLITTLMNPFFFNPGIPSWSNLNSNNTNLWITISSGWKVTSTASHGA
jgi:hypothetical protein